MEEFTVVDGQKISAATLFQLREFLTSFQLEHEPISEASCPLCNMDLAEERIHYEDDAVLIVDTRTKKGHKERIMALTRKHGIQQDREILNEVILELIAVGKQIFDEDFILLSDRFSSVNYHWHIVASDLNPEADDYQQIMETPYVLIKNKLQVTSSVKRIKPYQDAAQPDTSTEETELEIYTEEFQS